jgi:hypothetical protein
VFWCKTKGRAGIPHGWNAGIYSIWAANATGRGKNLDQGFADHPTRGH